MKEKQIMLDVHVMLKNGFGDKTILYFEETNIVQFQNICSFMFMEEINSLSVSFVSNVSPEKSAILMQAFIKLFENEKYNFIVRGEEWWDENGVYIGEEARLKYFESIKNS